MRLRCDACGATAPDVVAPILYGLHGWREFTIDGEHEGRRWEATVLLCDGSGGWKPTGKGCKSRMEDFVEHGGQAGHGPKPPTIQTCRGGQSEEPTYMAAAA